MHDELRHMWKTEVLKLSSKCDSGDEQTKLNIKKENKNHQTFSQMRRS